MNTQNKIQNFQSKNNLSPLEFESKLDFLVNEQKGTSNKLEDIGDDLSNKLEDIGDDLRKGFIGLAIRNEELLKSNDQLKEQLDEITKELTRIKEERQEKENRKKLRENRKRLDKRDPMTAEIYKELIQTAQGTTYRDVRLRLAFCILAVTGVRINELLPLKVFQLETLIRPSGKTGWIAIDRSKRGPSNHKAFLTKEGTKIVQDRKKDFEFIFLMKEPDSFIFTSEINQYQILRRETITKHINKVMRLVSNKFEDKPNITSHSFRIGYITQLWKDTKDIEFVKQTIGHCKLDTTSSYVTKLSNQEREKRISEL